MPNCQNDKTPKPALAGQVTYNWLRSTGFCSASSSGSSMKTIPEILDLVIGPIENLPIAMMHCKVVADALGYEPFQEWVTKEINGYTHRDEVPNYRMTVGQLQGQYERYLIDITDDRVPPHLIPAVILTYVETIPIYQSIGALAALPTISDQLRFPACMESELLRLVNPHFGTNGRFLNLWVSCPVFTYSVILATVQQKLVGFLSDLNQLFPTEADIANRTPEKNAEIDQTFGRYISIGQVHTVIIAPGPVAIDQSSNVFQQINVGNWPELDEFLDRQNISAEKRAIVKEILEKANEGDESPENQGKLVEWIEEAASDMTGGVADVLKGATKKAATDVLVDGIKRYAPAVGQWALVTAMK